MSNSGVISKLEKNPKDLSEEARRLLIKVAENILKDPQNEKLRTLQKSNATISKKVLGVYGGPECLTLMGFRENDTCFKLPIDASLKRLEQIRDEISRYKESCVPNNTTAKTESNRGAVPKRTGENIDAPEVTIPEEIIKRVILPPFHSTFLNPFLREVALRFHVAQYHDDKTLRQRAKKLIPLRELEISAQERLRMLQKAIKKDKEQQDLEVSFQDMFILELLSWFKYRFFTWVDSPQCERCSGQTKFSHMCTDRNMLVYTERVEMHRCDDCNCLTPFPRYNDLNILMETRKGRCGEWANVFTLFCRAMDWDARHVFDETDHVWTEVYSFAQKRWLHCDPCENACDSPLIYESGWKKDVSYVMAYSGEEVQDVTWRYSSNHKLVLQRRNKCSEEELINALISLREERQKNFSTARRNYLVRRLLGELLELMVERKPNDKDQEGRLSGSLAWRLTRGERQADTKGLNYIWGMTDEDVKNDHICIRYSTSLDRYERILGFEAKGKILDGWNEGTFENSGLFRKEEKDWKVAYLARREGVAEGKISWKFNVEGSNRAFDVVHIYFNYVLFESGRVDVTVTNEHLKSVPFDYDSKSLKTVGFSGSKTITVSAVLKGGNGDVSWQHAQLFRQPLNSEEYPFNALFTFKKCT